MRMIDLRIVADKDTLGRQAAKLGGEAIRAAQAKHGHANIIVATGASQFEVLTHLVAAEAHRLVEGAHGFHLDEYVGLGDEHPAKPRRYRACASSCQIGGKVEFAPVDGEGDPLAGRNASTR